MNKITNTDFLESKNELLSATHSSASTPKTSDKKEKQILKTVTPKTPKQGGSKTTSNRSKTKQSKKVDPIVSSKQKIQGTKGKAPEDSGGKVSEKKELIVSLKEEGENLTRMSSNTKTKSLKTSQMINESKSIDSEEKDFIDQLKGIVKEPTNSFVNEAIKSEQERARRKPFPDVSLNDEEIPLVIPKKTRNSKHFVWALAIVGLIVSVECYIHRKPHNLTEHLAHVSEHTVVQRIEEPKPQQVAIPQNTKSNTIQIIDSKGTDKNELKVSSRGEATRPTMTNTSVSQVSMVEKLKPLPDIHLSDKNSDFRPLNYQNYEFALQSAPEPVLAEMGNAHQQAITEHIDKLLKGKNAIQENLTNQVHDWLYKQHIQGVAYKEAQSCLILNSKIFYVGDIINTNFNLVWTSIDPDKKQLHFQDASGNAYVTSY